MGLGGLGGGKIEVGLDWIGLDWEGGACGDRGEGVEGCVGVREGGGLGVGIWISVAYIDCGGYFCVCSNYDR